MRKQVTYQTADGGTDTVTRDRTHTETEQLLTAYNTDDDPDSVQIPIHRVARVDSVTQEH